MSEDKLLVDDYLVGKVDYTEKKVEEALNKIHFIKNAVLNNDKSSAADHGGNSGHLLSHHQK
mgnify:CR=1 FL=1